MANEVLWHGPTTTPSEAARDQRSEPLVGLMMRILG